MPKSTFDKEFEKTDWGQSIAFRRNNYALIDGEWVRIDSVANTLVWEGSQHFTFIGKATKFKRAGVERDEPIEKFCFIDKE